MTPGLAGVRFEWQATENFAFPSFHFGARMEKSTSNVETTLARTLAAMARSPDLTDAERQWLHQFAVRTVAEFTLYKEKQQQEASR